MRRRRRNNRARNKTRRVLIGVCCVLAVVLAVLIGVVVTVLDADSPSDQGGSSSTSSSSVPKGAASIKELVVETIEEQGKSMIVTTSYGVIKYPVGFSELIHIDTESFADHTRMNFSTVVDGETVPLYTLYFNKYTGVSIGSMLVDGTVYAVTAEVYDLDQVDEDHILSCQAAQETFHDVIVSLEENEGFLAS